MHVFTRTQSGLGAAPRCLRWRMWQPGDDTDSEYVCAQWESPTATPTAAEAPSANQTGVDCGVLWAEWFRRYPNFAQCAGQSEDRRYFDSLCSQLMRGDITSQTMLRAMGSYSQQRCAQQPQTPPGTQVVPPPRPPPPPPTSPPQMPPGIPPVGETPDDEPPLLQEQPGFTPNGDTPSQPVLQRDWRRQFGPIVGVGLLVAGGLTVYRVKRKKKRR